ncbi:MAG: type III-B CRISPR module RAMP protein Cmr6 [Desulfobacca sp.]|uniref:type III-B CRISPR module RAMP protein Cmr6 n=1 Tax=Desulfobacca sp. TaxID=2067990 RepID=UPI0040498A18
MVELPGSRWLRDKTNLQAVRQACKAVGANASLVQGKYILWENDQFNKKEHLEKVAGIRPPVNPAFYQRLKQRKNHYPPPVRVFPLTTQSRLIMNMGNESILETSIALHHLYGWPVLAGSAIKGVTRHYVTENQLLSAPEIEQYFGHETEAAGRQGGLQQGQIIFGDAWPQNPGTHLELDLVNPHYGHYYREGQWPSDNRDPVPVPFLAIKPGVAFEFVLALTRKGRAAAGAAEERVLDTIQNFVTKALQTYGFGAKTGAGYGYFA